MSVTTEISNQDEVIDSRNIIDRIDELRELIEGEGCDETCKEYQEELKALQALADQCEGYSDWAYGETLIHRSHWVDYVEQLLKDCGDVPDNIPSYIAIDWQETADRIEVDYMSVDFNGEEYLMRSC